MDIYVEIPGIDRLGEAAATLIDQLGDHRKIAFSGEMGAGKTTLIQVLCKKLGVVDVVSSPTFALINEYFTHSGESIYHFDLYRIEDIVELYDIGYEDYFFSDARCFIEWPEKAKELMPDDIIILKISILEDGTRVVSGPVEL